MFYVFRLYLYSMKTINENQFFVWEENDLTAPMMKSETSGITAPKNTINETKNVSVKNGCEDTGKRKEWKRNCPKCGKELYYSSLDSFLFCKKRNSICIECRGKNHKEYYKNWREYNKIKKWIRACPKCGKEKIYFHRGKYNRDTKINRLCRNCWKIRGKLYNGPFEYKCPECGKKTEYAGKGSLDRAVKGKRLCNSCKFLGERSVWYNTHETHPCFGRKLCEETKLKISKGNKGKKRTEEQNKRNGDVRRGIPLKPETKRILREKVIERCKFFNGKWHPSYNKKACEVIEELNKNGNYNFQHALNGGEYQFCGYFVDGYDENRNVVIEIDEDHHYDNNGNLKPKDIERQKEIIENLKCKFLRYKISSKLLYEI